VAGRGRLVALEGVDGCGKSTQARLLADALGALVTAEPGSTPLGAALRRILLDPDLPAVSARAEALLVCADRAEHVAQVVGPALAAGRWVVTDRYSGSTIAYQGYGRELDPAPLRELVAWATAGIEADLVVLLDVPLAVARARLGETRPDRLEGLDEAFHDRVRRGFLAQATAEPQRWAVVDGAARVDEVAAAVHDAVTGRLGAP